MRPGELLSQLSLSSRKNSDQAQPKMTRSAMPEKNPSGIACGITGGPGGLTCTFMIAPHAFSSNRRIFAAVLAADRLKKFAVELPGIQNHLLVVHVADRFARHDEIAGVLDIDGDRFRTDRADGGDSLVAIVQEYIEAFFNPL